MLKNFGVADVAQVFIIMRGKLQIRRRDGATDRKQESVGHFERDQRNNEKARQGDLLGGGKARSETVFRCPLTRTNQLSSLGQCLQHIAVLRRHPAFHCTNTTSLYYI